MKTLKIISLFLLIGICSTVFGQKTRHTTSTKANKAVYLNNKSKPQQAQRLGCTIKKNGKFYCHDLDCDGKCDNSQPHPNPQGAKVNAKVGGVDPCLCKPEEKGLKLAEPPVKPTKPIKNIKVVTPAVNLKNVGSRVQPR